MKRLFTLLLVAVSCALVGAQDAKIIVIDKDDASYLSKVYEHYTEAKKYYEETRDAIAKKYTVVDGKAMDGWENPQFNSDFKAMIPSPVTSGIISGGGSGWQCSGGICCNSPTVTTPPAHTWNPPGSTLTF